MGFWTWLLGGSPKPAPERPDFVNLPGLGTYTLDVVGESHYQDALNEICGGKSEDGYHDIVQAFLIYEDDNAYDDQAIRVEIQGKVVGYLTRAVARNYRRQMKGAAYENLPGVCSAKIVGGWDRGDGDAGSYGVKLDLRQHNE